MAFENLDGALILISAAAFIGVLVLFFLIRYSNKKLVGESLELLEEIRKVESHLKKFEKENSEEIQSLVEKVHSIERKIEKEHLLGHNPKEKAIVTVKH